ncbi:MAG: TonB-dependent receptor [Pseudomonadota bacterium]
MKPLAIVLATTTALTFSAHAQEAADEPLVESPILVTTPGVDRPADELIGNATKIDREDIVETLEGSLGNTLDRLPGVSTTFFGVGASRPVLRGLGAERVQVLSNGIGVIDASAASPDHQVSADGIDAESIEILRGPAALAYGGQAIGGVVNVIDGLIAEATPDAPASGEVFGAYNSVNEGSEAAGRGTFAAGPLVFSLSGSLRDFDNYDIPDFAESSLLRAMEEEEHGDEEGEDDHDHEDEEVRGTQENSFVETSTLAGGVSYVGEQGFFGVAVRQQTAEYGLPGGHAHEEGEEHGDEEGEEHSEEEEEENPFIDLEHTRVDLRGGYNLDAGPVTRVLGTLSIVDYEHTEFEAPGEAGTVFENEGVEGRVEVDHEIAGFQGAVGVQFFDTDFVAEGEEAFVSPTESQSLGLFVYQTREWDSGYGIEGGLRYETIERDNIINGTADFDLFSGSFGAHRHLNDAVFIGAQVSYTERAPNESELFAFGPHLATNQFEVGNPDADKETGINLEGTARYTTDLFSVGVNLFVTEFSDFIFLAPSAIIEDGVIVTEEDGLPVFAFVQDDASFIGGEIYGTFMVENVLAADWEFSGSVDFVESDLDSGGNVPLQPPLTIHLGASAEWGAFEVGADVTVADEQDNPGAGELPTDSYTLLNLRAEYDLSDLGFGADGTEAFIEARNVTDEEARLATSVLKDLAPLPGQNIRVGLRVAF